MQGTIKSLGIPIMGSTEYSQMRMKGPHSGTSHHFLSNDNNSNRYDVTQAMVDSNAIIFRKEALLVGRTIAPQGIIFWSDLVKAYYIDSWMSEGAAPDRYDNVAMIGLGGSTNTAVETKAKAKVQLTRTSA